jgi:hypothetical protein
LAGEEQNFLARRFLILCLNEIDRKRRDFLAGIPEPMEHAIALVAVEDKKFLFMLPDE